MTASALLNTIMTLGESLLTSGAEVNRTEDTIRRVCAAYGFVRCDVFTITSGIIVTVRTPDGEILTQTRRIRSYKTDLQRVHEINQLSRRLCKEELCPEHFSDALDQIFQTPTPSHIQLLLVYGIISGAFSLFFGGTYLDCICSFIGGLLLYALLQGGQRIGMNHLVLTVLCSALSAITALSLVRLGVGTNTDKIIIGNIMLLIPGLSFTTSVRDMISGDTISGLLGVCEAILKSAAIAVGFSLIFYILGG